MNVKERAVHAPNLTDWSWVKGSATLSSPEQSIDYSLYGLHFIPNGTINLFGLPDGMRIDIRNIPRLYPDHGNVTHTIILAELEKELRIQENALMLSDVEPDGMSLRTKKHADRVRRHAHLVSAAGLPLAASCALLDNSRRDQNVRGRTA